MNYNIVNGPGKWKPSTIWGRCFAVIYSYSRCLMAIAFRHSETIEHFGLQELFIVLASMKESQDINRLVGFVY